jgi:hypothetical protein
MAAYGNCIMENASNAEEAAAQQGWSTGMVIGVAAGGAAALGLVMLGLWWRWSWQQKQKRLQVSYRQLLTVLPAALTYRTLVGHAAPGACLQSGWTYQFNTWCF